MIQETSLSAYRQIKENGLLSEMRFKVYDAIVKYGPATAGEICHWHLRNMQQHSITPRFAELQRLGVIKIAGKRECGVTGATAIVWESSGLTPNKIERKPTKTEIIAMQSKHIVALQAEVERLSNLAEKNKWVSTNPAAWKAPA
jgi:hypothetical protein